MSRLHIYIHIVFGVKWKCPSLESGKRSILFDHIVDNAKANNIEIQQINGHDDHVHFLLKLTASQSISKLMQSIKGESSWWANNQALFANKLEWSKGYYARSVDPENVWLVRKYIEGQGKHEDRTKYFKSFLIPEPK